MLLSTIIRSQYLSPHPLWVVHHPPMPHRFLILAIMP
nr:MAG TPA: hypothetical protein [Caudoviricetes sp.]